MIKGVAHASAGEPTVAIMFFRRQSLKQFRFYGNPGKGHLNLRFQGGWQLFLCRDQSKSWQTRVARILLEKLVSPVRVGADLPGATYLPWQFWQEMFEIPL